MRETPPYSLVEMKLLLSQYLDGDLEAEQMLAVDELLQQFPEYQTEFLKLQAAQRLLQDSMARQTDGESEASGSLWSKIASQLESDQEATAEIPTELCSPEWVSAYIDGEISRQDPDRETFECQLAGNAEASKRLADLTQVSEQVRQFGYRMENACTVDLTEVVMAAFQAEQQGALQTASASDVLDEQQPLDEEWELLSAFADQALSPRETIQASQLIESSDSARAKLAQLNRLLAHIQRVGQGVSQMPSADLWPAIKESMQALEKEEKASQAGQSKRLVWLRKAAIPLAATVLLALLSLPSLHLNSFAPLENVARFTRAQAADVATQQALPVQDQELASVPASVQNGPQPDVTPSSELNDASDAETMASVMDAMASQPVSETAPLAKAQQPPAQPMLEHSAVPMAADMQGDARSTGLSTDEASPKKTPSSEAYLFDALSRQSSDEEFSNILGK